MIAILLASLQIVSLLYFSGFGLTVLMFNNKLWRHAFWIMPWLGTVFIVLVAVALNLAKISMSSGSFIILFFAGILAVASMIIKRKVLVLDHADFFIGIFAAILFLFNIYPLITNAGFPTTISLGNLDPVTYSNSGDFLINNTVFEGGTFQHYKPYRWSTGDILSSGFRWGAPLLLAFLSTITGLFSYQIYSILTILYFAMTFPLVYIFTKILYPKGKKIIFFLVFITFGMNSTLTYMLYHMFLPQFIFTALFVVFMMIFYEYIRNNQTVRSAVTNTHYAVILGIILASLMTLYAEGIMFLLVPIAIYAGYQFFLKKSYFALTSLVKILLTALLVNPVSFATSIRMNFIALRGTAQNAFIGWEKIPYAAPMEMMGFYNLNFSRDIPPLLDLIIGLPIIAIWILGLIKMKERIFFMCFLLFFILVYAYYRFLIPHYYVYHKAITYSVFLYSILFSVGLSHFILQYKKRMLGWFAIVFLFMLALRSSYRTIYQLYWHTRIVDKALVSLSELNTSQTIDGPFYMPEIYLGEYDLWRRLWREHFLSGKKIVSGQNYRYEGTYLNVVQLVLAEKALMEREERKIQYTKVLWENEYYILGKIKPMPVHPDIQVK
ncbi:hypothetical protein A3H80_03965 [Candidatus Roizmanbacteria bacterium RIFCSPLOWO2_02_FULL_37_19]|uniref:Glycosyltransferase RgtA/B/C/D-like domain-containing protein n=1 Tax=Candidatus Roizmanbacteria bacterium RIFCSPHIGHO2_02_FULL_37_24 TaxID=1802037 RepID=A0A1F7GUQ1_9BACT|nr:MAG: hypothetical protein A2862_01175 [Candidatus Roizmanbacteria bacterium RIFCSPHIGHO2_01_FULL_38_41]OGK22817.1 MAG: hypothetical protein A3C24_04330 [Candidatus Roizmanbacteria bacterium RIFCSPHIGHO2_02_FULL_37_24]OGK33387.1 MAG: hypothetical protein A3E10_01835 [Candidatus Roizmanbacteria bacterium RIFCSPHIGHO2_12_FULL_37_23]OGK44347.1 MAG: hypothetical protein A2956_03945 [Candidatus Roizmanbacteria bacterium RIFCSPLOWO2_01_FULL_37_57]OGK53665.1 MAG: hypothetical protein A3H80_03965 [Ca